MPAKPRGAVVSSSEAAPFRYRQSFPASSAQIRSTGASASQEISEEEAQAREGEAWKRGLAEGEARARAALEEKLEQERSAIEKSIREFAVRRDEYFQQVEAEVVRLALSIAKRVLDREAQADPLVLSGAVRSALARLSGAASVRLRVSPERAALWRSYLQRSPEPGSEGEVAEVAEVIEDAELDAAQVILETSIGTAHLGLDEQFDEIDRGLSDLHGRPRPAAEGPAHGTKTTGKGKKKRQARNKQRPSPRAES